MQNENANLEFRKIPSLQFLYEVNSNGTIFRNVKSKKQSKIVIDYHHSSAGYAKTMVNIKGKTKRVMIHRVVAECWLGPIPEGLQVDHIDRNSLNNNYHNLRYVNHSQQMKNRVLSQRIIDQATKNILSYNKKISVPCWINNIKFDSITAAAKDLANKLGLEPEAVRAKMKKRRSNILGYEVIYGNAETRRTHSKE